MAGGEINWPLVVSAAGLAVLVLSSVGGLVWKLSRIEIGLRAEAAKEAAELSAKLYQVEIWARDEFVRKGSFEVVIARVEKGYTDLRSEIAGRLDRMSDKIDGKLGTNH